MGGDAEDQGLQAGQGQFQSTPPHGGRPTVFRRCCEMVRFQSTPPHGGRLWAGLPFFRFLVFQSTPPHGGRPKKRETTTEESKFQSTPPHGGRRVKSAIHMALNVMFQSTPPHGGRQHKVWRIRWLYLVSIHAPAWGATRRRQRGIAETVCFNPRPRMGGDKGGQ